MEPQPHLLFGLAVLSLSRLLLDVRDHGEGGAVVAVGQVDDVGDGRESGPLAAGANGRALLTHGQQELDIEGKITSLRQTHATVGVGCGH